jgi:hypothetical protein
MRVFGRRGHPLRVLSAFVLLAGVGLLQCSSSDDRKADARDCCTCIANNHCWDFDACPSNKDCVCAILGNTCSTDPPCLAVDEACVQDICKARCDKYF